MLVGFLSLGPAPIHAQLSVLCVGEIDSGIVGQASGLLLEDYLSEVDTWFKLGEADVSNGGSLNERFGDSTKQER